MPLPSKFYGSFLQFGLRPNALHLNNGHMLGIGPVEQSLRAIVVSLSVLAIQTAHSQTLDSLNPNPNSWVSSLAVQADGRIILVGGFGSIGATPRGRIARLSASGTLDATFGNPTENGNVFVSALQPDGKILVGGEFTSLAGASRSGLGRLNTNGTLDTSFSFVSSGSPPPGSSGEVTRFDAILVQQDGKILVGGSYRTIYSGGSVWSSLIFRLNTNGSGDSSFNQGGVLDSGYVNTMALQTNGKVLVGGGFSKLRGQTRNGLGRLNSNGTLDIGFNPNMNDEVSALAVQPDGKILVGGEFSAVNGQARTKLARLNADGTLDEDFSPAVGGSTAIILSVAIQADGKVLVGGLFTSIASQARTNLARLNPDGTLDQTFVAHADNYVYG